MQLDLKKFKAVITNTSTAETIELVCMAVSEVAAKKAIRRMYPEPKFVVTECNSEQTVVFIPIEPICTN